MIDLGWKTVPDMLNRIKIEENIVFNILFLHYIWTRSLAVENADKLLWPKLLPAVIIGASKQ